MDRTADLKKIREALRSAGKILEKYTPGEVDAIKKAGGSPVTQADLELDAALKSILPEDGDGWLSEETADSPDRLGKDRVWVVDPLDGTKEFVMGIPEWCVSIGLVEKGSPVAGGIYNPATGETFLGSVETGIELNDEPARTTETASLEGATVLASRSEVNRGEWERFQGSAFQVIPMGSVAYKLARVAAGLDDATWTLVPKSEWDVAGGAALVRAGGGTVWLLDGKPPTMNREIPKYKGFVACGPGLDGPIRELLGIGAD